MREDETEIDMVKRHIKEGADLIVRQYALIARLEQGGLEAYEAKTLLVILNEVQRQHEDHLARALAKQASA